LELKAFFIAEPQSAQGIYILCLPLRKGPVQYAWISNSLTILVGRYPANIKNNPPKGVDFLMRYRLKTVRDAFARRAYNFNFLPLITSVALYKGLAES